MSEESAAKVHLDPVEEAKGPDGETLTLRRAQGGFEILSDGKVVMASAVRRSERELVNVGMVPLRDRTDITVLLAGLGMGYALSALLESSRVVRVDVVEHSAAIIEWNRSHLSVLHREPPLADSRVHVHNQSLSEFLRAMRYKAVPDLELESGGFLAALLDIDNGPSALSRAQNAGTYTEDGLEDIEGALRAGGVLCFWSEQREPETLARVQSRFMNIAEIALPVDVPGSAGLDYLYRARKRPPAGVATRPRAQA